MGQITINFMTAWGGRGSFGLIHVSVSSLISQLFEKETRDSVRALKFIRTERKEIGRLIGIRRELNSGRRKYCGSYRGKGFQQEVGSVGTRRTFRLSVDTRFYFSGISSPF